MTALQLEKKAEDERNGGRARHKVEGEHRGKQGGKKRGKTAVKTVSGTAIETQYQHDEDRHNT